MKLFFQTIFSSAFLIGSSPMAFALSDGNQTHMVTEMKPKVTICFTIARKRDCEGFGICNFNASLTDAKMNNAISTVYKDDHTNALVFEIDRSKGISAYAYDRFFKSGSFTMEDDAPIPYDLARDLGVSTNASLVQGRYAIVESSGILKMIIPFR